MYYTPYVVSESVFYTLDIRPPAFNPLQMAWVAGLGLAEHLPALLLHLLVDLRRRQPAELLRGEVNPVLGHRRAGHLCGKYPPGPVASRENTTY